MIKKNYRMNEEDLEVIQQVKKQHGFHSDSETLRYIVRKNMRMKINNRKDDAVDFHTMGIDHIFVDECHYQNF